MQCDVVINERGGKQSHIAGRADLFPALAYLSIAKVLQQGNVKYPPDPDGPNWHKISSMEHANHMLHHFYQHVSGDRSEDHLSHCATRACMMLEMWIIEQGRVAHGKASQASEYPTKIVTGHTSEFNPA